MALNRAKVLETADKLVKQGKLADAIRHYHALSEDNPRDVNTINRIGDLYVRLGKAKEAIRQFLRIADFYAGDGFHLKAIAMYKKITKLDPSNVEANERLAELYAKQGLTIEARTQYLALAEQCLKSGLKQKAILIYEKVQVLEPNNLKVRLALADLQGREGEPAKAVEGLLAVAVDLRKRSLNDEALKVLQKASRLEPNNPAILGQMAELLQSVGKNPKEALKSLESLWQAEPQNPRYSQMLAEAYLNLGKKAEFDKMADSAGTGEARVILGEAEARFLLSRGDQEGGIGRLAAAAEQALRDVGPERGASLLEQILELQPDRADILEKLLELWTNVSNREGMIAALERLARLHCQEEAWERATQVLDRLQDLSPENPAVAELRPRVDLQRGVGASPGGEASAGSVPSLEELEKVVELEGEEEEAPFVEAGLPVEEVEAAPEESAEIPEDEEEGEEQDAAYAGKSVIQEMRGEPARELVDEDFLNEHFTEAEVFLKYGLVEKAKEQLNTILARYPEHVPSWSKLVEIHTEEGRKGEAAVACLKIAAIHRGKGEQEAARELEEEARRLDPRAGSRGVAPATPPSLPVPEAAESLELPASPPAPEPALDLDLELTDLPGKAASTVTPAGTAPTSARVAAASEEDEELSVEIVEEEGASPEGSALDPEKVNEFDFFLDQGLIEEAEEILDGLERSAPGHPELQMRRRRLKGLRKRPAVEPSSPPTGELDIDVERAFGKAPAVEASAVPPPEAESSASDEGFFDLAAELKAHAIDSTPEAGEPLAGVLRGEEASLDEIFKAFRKRVDQQVEEEDYETRYNLGIAYKEMGLLDEAIGEFQYASRDPKLFLECCSILGICFKEKGMTDLAIRWYRKALESTGHAEEKYQGLRYDLGELHAERGEFPQALALFSEVYGINSNYRDVASKIRELKKRVG